MFILDTQIFLFFCIDVPRESCALRVFMLSSEWLMAIRWRRINNHTNRCLDGSFKINTQEDVF